MTAEFLLDQHALICTDSEGDRLDLRPRADVAGCWMAAPSAMGAYLHADDLAAIRVWVDQQIGPPKLLAAAEQLVEDLIMAEGDTAAIDKALGIFGGSLA